MTKVRVGVGGVRNNLGETRMIVLVDNKSGPKAKWVTHGVRAGQGHNNTELVVVMPVRASLLTIAHYHNIIFNLKLF